MIKFTIQYRILEYNNVVMYEEKNKEKALERFVLNHPYGKIRLMIDGDTHKQVSIPIRFSDGLTYDSNIMKNNEEFKLFKLGEEHDRNRV